VLGLDRDPAFVAALSEAARELPAEADVGDARNFSLEQEFNLILAPMQLVQLFADVEERARCLRCVANHLVPGGVAAFAIVEAMPEPVDAAPLLPDTREVDGWVFSSLPVDVALDSGEIRVRRLRQTVSPAGELSEELDEVLLHPLAAAALEREAEVAGLRVAGRRPIAATDAHVGSTAVLLAKEG
jgi:SAM-dependent methyltransferase